MARRSFPLSLFETCDFVLNEFGEVERLESTYVETEFEMRELLVEVKLLLDDLVLEQKYLLGLSFFNHLFFLFSRETH